MRNALWCAVRWQERQLSQLARGEMVLRVWLLCSAANVADVPTGVRIAIALSAVDVSAAVPAVVGVPYAITCAAHSQ